MNKKSLQNAVPPARKLTLRGLGTFAKIILLVLLGFNAYATTKTSNATGNWSDGTIWTPSGVPTSADDVIIHGGNVVTIDGAYSCNNLSVGDATGATTTLKITAAANSLSIGGDLKINPSNKANTYSLAAGPGAISINGTFSTWGTAGTNSITVSTGTLTFAPAVTIAASTQNITITGAGTINFNNSLTDNYSKLVPGTNSIVNFAGNYIVSTTNATWNNKGTAVFTGTSTVTANANIAFFNVQTSGSATFSSGGGVISTTGAFTLNNGSALTLNTALEVGTNWTNNGGSLSGGSNTITFNGSGKTIGGTASTTFPNVQIGRTAGATNVTYTMNNDNTFSSLSFSGTGNLRTFTLAAGTTLNVTNDLTINQPTGTVTNSLAVNTGACTVGGNLYFNGSSNTSTCVAKVAVTTGSFTVGGTVNWMSNTEVATEVISATTGTLTFNKSVTMGSGSGTLAVTGTGTINFNGTAIPSFNFGGSLSPVFTTAGNCNLNFATGFANNSNALTLNSTSTVTITGSGSITANADITVGDIQFNGNDTIASAAGSLIIPGSVTIASGSNLYSRKCLQIGTNWVNNGGTFAGSNDTVTFTAAAPTISGTGSTSFRTLQLGTTGGATAVACTMSSTNSCTNLILTSGPAARTLSLGAGVTLTASGNVTIYQPTAAVTNNISVATAALVINGDLSFTGTDNTATYIGKVTVTTGSLTVGGRVNWMSNTAVATEVITATTGTLTFSSPLTMGSGSGTLSVTSTGTINFNGALPSFTFGSASNSPVFTSTNGCTLNFGHGFTNNGAALTLAATSTSNFTGAGSVAPNANITFGNAVFQGTDSILTGAGNVVFAGSVTLNSGSSLYAPKSFEVDANWTNNGGTLTASGDTITFNGAAPAIGGTSSTSFPTLQIGLPAGAVAVAANLNNSNSCAALILSASSKARTLTIAASTTLTVSGNVTINQATALATNSLAVNTGTCTVGGNLNFIGTNNTTTWIAKVAVTTGTFSLAGNVNWMSNTEVATEVITVSTGTLTFQKQISMGAGSGTISVTGTGTINFNGTSPSFTFGGAATSPVFTTTNGCTLNFAHGMVNNTNALTLAATSNANFTGTGSVVPNADITFGNAQLNSYATDTISAAAGLAYVAGTFTLSSASKLVNNADFEIRGNWTNNGGTVSSGINAIIMNGTALSISGSAITAFQKLQVGSAASAVVVSATVNNNVSCTSLVFHSSTKARTLTVAASKTLTVNGDITMNQPAGAVTNSLTVGAGTCTTTGNLNFVGATNTSTWVGKVAVTSGTFTLNGNVTWMSNTAVATEVITVSTGTINFANSLTMGTGTGTLSVTGTGIINFNGTTAPSFSFGGAATAPVFTTTAGCTLNFKKGFTNSGAALTLAHPSSAVFTGSGTITPTAAITFSNVQINSSYTATLGGNISVAGNWTDNGTFTPSTYTVTFNGASGSTQTITRTGGETFYGLTASVSGSTLQLNNDVIVSNAITMGGHNINMNGNTLQLGNGAGASLIRTSGIAYGGTWKRWFPASAITSTSGSYYGLFPVGTPTDYRPVAIASTVSPTGAGYVTAAHNDNQGITLVTYTDNESDNIQAITDMNATVNNVSVTGGTYNLQVTYTGLNSSGSLTDLKLETHSANTMGSVGTTAATSGTVASPTVSRTGLAVGQLSKVWVLATKNRSSTPLRPFYYSRKSGNWSDATAGNATWSYTSGGSGPSCDCTPVSTAYAVVSPGQTVTVDASSSADYVDVSAGGTLKDNGSSLTVNKDLTTIGTGKLTNTGTWSVTGNLTLSSITVSTATGTVSVTGNVNIPAGGSYAQNSGSLTLSGDATINGTLNIGSSTTTFNGTGTNISGTGSITGTANNSINLTNDKTIVTGTNLVFGTSNANMNVAINGTSNITNNGTVKIYGNLTGTTSGSTWTNAANSTLEVTGNALTTGTLSVSAVPNTVKYSGNGSQNINAPATGYYNLTVANGGTKTLLGNTTLANALTISDSATLDESTSVLSGAADLNMTGNSILKLTRAVSGTYPELGGDYNLTGGTVIINQTAGLVTATPAIYYNLKIIGSGTCDLTSVTDISGDVNIQGSSSILTSTPITVTGSFNYNSTATSTLATNLTAGGFSISAGTFNDGGNTININRTGNWVNNGGTFNATGTVMFTGTARQQITGSQPTAFNNLTINSNNGVQLNVSPAAATIISGNLNMAKGNIYTDDQNILRVLNGATVSSGSSASFVEGPMIKVGNDDFIFPVGKSGRWRRAGVSGITDPTTEVKAEYFAAAYPDHTTINGSHMSKVSGVEYWMIDRQVSTDSLQLRLFWEGAASSFIQECPNITIAHYKNGAWNEEPGQAVSGSLCIGSGSGSVLTTGYISSFSPFTFGGITPTALPIELLSFDAVKKDNAVETQWATAIEINNASFTVERSANGTDFETVGSVDGAGNSTTQHNYQLMDEKPLSGTSYYRLRQTDYDGHFTVSNIVAVNFSSDENGFGNTVTVYPNPAHSIVNVKISKPEGQVVVKIYDVSGWEVYSKVIEGNNAEQLITIPTGILTPGVYVVSTYTGKTSHNEKLVVN